LKIKNKASIRFFLYLLIVYGLGSGGDYIANSQELDAKADSEILETATSIQKNVSKPLRLIHYQTHYRYKYGHALIKMALDKMGVKYIIKPYSKEEINEARGELLLKKGEVDFQFMSTTQERERDLIAVKKPIYQYLLGMRLLLVKNDNKGLLQHVNSLDDLREFIAGHGKHWGDLPVYAANNLKVDTSVESMS